MREGRVLYPTDFSVNSLVGIDRAVEYCASQKKELIVLHTYRLISSKNGDSPYSLKKGLDIQAKQIFEQLEQDKLAGKNLSYKLISEVGFVDDRIAHHVEEEKYDKILLCDSLHSQLKHKIEESKSGTKELYSLPVVQV